MMVRIENGSADGQFLELLRAEGTADIFALTQATQVTATAVRQRLTRLMAQGLICRDTVRNGRGRPRHLYRLTEKGLRATGSNYADLAVALWTHICRIKDRTTRDTILRQVAETLAQQYQNQLQGATTAQRMRSLAELLAQRRIRVSVRDEENGTVLSTHTCPYPGLAEHDRNVCKLERLLFSQLVGRDVRLANCRLDGGTECRFQAK